MNRGLFRLNTLTAQIRMLLQNHGLRQIDESYMRSLDHEALFKLSTKLLSDLKEAREQLGQNSRNSSRPQAARPRG